MDELSEQEAGAFKKLSNEQYNMTDLKTKTIGRLQDGGLLVSVPEKSFGKITLLRIAASLAFLACGYWFGTRDLFTLTQPNNMNKYALFLYENNEFTVADGNTLVLEYSEWASSLAARDKLVVAEKLNDSELYWLGKSTVQNSTSKLSGYFVFYAANFEEAKQIAQTHPHTKYGGGMELRPIDIVQ